MFRTSDSLNWRRGIEEVKQASATRTEAVRRSTEEERAKRMAESQAITQGFQKFAQGIHDYGEAVDAKKEREQNEELKRQQMEKNQLDIDNAKIVNPLQQENLRKANKQADLSLETSQFNLERAKSEKAKADDAEAGAARAALASYKGKKPSNWDSMSDSERIAFVKTTDEYKKSQADIAAKWASTKNINANTALTEVKTTSEMVDLVNKTQPTIVTDPEKISQQAAGLDSKRDFRLINRRQKGFEATSEKAEIVFKNRQRNGMIAQLGSKDPSNPIQLNSDGTINESEAKKWKYQGLSGLWARASNDPKYAEIKAYMVDSLSTVAKSGDYGALNWPSEIKRAYEAQGGNLADIGARPDLFFKFMDEVHGNKAVVGYFNVQAFRDKQTVDSIKSDFEKNDSFAGVSTNAINDVLHKISPTPYNTPGSKEYQAINGGNTDPQTLANAAFGAGAYQILPPVMQAHTLTQAAKNGAAYAHHSERNVNLQFDDPGNQKKLEGLRSGRPDALKKVADTDPPPAGPIPGVTAGASFDPANGNPNTPVVVNVKSGGYTAVTGTHGLPAAGATPVGTPIYTQQAYIRDIAQQKSRQKGWDANLMKAFQGGSVEAGAAYAQ